LTILWFGPNVVPIGTEAAVGRQLRIEADYHLTDGYISNGKHDANGDIANRIDAAEQGDKMLCLS
jgi:hypothetical protein